MMLTRRRTATVAVALVALCWCGAASAGLADQSALAKRFAPVVRIVTQAKECGPGEPYLPIDVNVLFGADTVSLRGPWNRTDLISIAPTASSGRERALRIPPRLPGGRAHSRLHYEQWARRISAGTKPTVYAHVVTQAGHPGKLALQYWLFYVFNDWNNLHEGDWEMIQLLFDASTPAAALDQRPVEVGYSQHEGAERASWDDSKLELVDGTHPVVHVAAGSHANFFGEALYLGSAASEGVGCDDTRGPTSDIRPVVRTIPTDGTEARAAFPWIGFEGRWGELQRAFYNGPTGPSLKRQWTQPFQWAEGWRSRSYAVPAGGVLGTRATDFFCSAVGGGSELLRRLVHEPRGVILVLAALIALLAFALSRVTWRPTAPLHLARRRAWGQIIAAAGRMYRHRMSLFVGIGLLFVPIALLIALLQTVVTRASSVAGISTEGEGGGLLVLLVVAVGIALTLLGARFRPDGDGTSPRGDRCRTAGGGLARLPARVRRSQVPLRRTDDLRPRSLAPRRLRGPDSDCGLADSPLGAHRSRDRVRGSLRTRGVAAERKPRSAQVVEGRVTHNSRGSDRVHYGFARRGASDPADGRAACRSRRRRRNRTQ
jgi:hypothetical protein